MEIRGDLNLWTHITVQFTLLLNTSLGYRETFQTLLPQSLLCFHLGFAGWMVLPFHRDDKGQIPEQPYWLWTCVVCVRACVSINYKSNMCVIIESLNFNIELNKCKSKHNTNLASTNPNDIYSNFHLIAPNAKSSTIRNHVK